VVAQEQLTKLTTRSTFNFISVLNDLDAVGAKEPNQLAEWDAQVTR